MIYPQEFPSKSNNVAEKIIFEKLSFLSNKFDIFYARKFVALSNFEKNEYEIDFIVCLPCKVIICLEVKGGIILFDGIKKEWYQNSKKLKLGPDEQASSATHSLINRYKSISKSIPIGWALCFPDCQIPYGTDLPTNLNKNVILDQKKLTFFEKAIDQLFIDLKNQYPSKNGCKKWEYESFVNSLLRGIGFVQVLGSRIKNDENKFIELIKDQIEIFRQLAENNKLLVKGPAGSGKTIIAKTLAQEYAENNKKVLLMCFNRTLSNKLSYELGIRNNENIVSCTFHSFAKRIIEEHDKHWWEANDKSNDDFWDLDVPAKLDNIINSFSLGKFNCIIIDEGQDFKELWFEVLFKFLEKNSKTIIFMDMMQDIFRRNVAIPEETTFTKFNLKYNCRNTNKIICYLEEVIDDKINRYGNPEGDSVVLRKCNNSTDIQRLLIQDIEKLMRDHSIRNDQILILLNSEKKDSSISNLKHIGDFEIKSLDNKGRFLDKCIHFTTIETFKGLEVDILFIIDVSNILPNEFKKRMYTESSRAKHKLFLYSINN